MAKLRSINPANGENLGSVKIATKAEVELTVEKAKQGLKNWSRVPLKRRKKVLLRFSSLLKKEKKGLAEMITREMGKPILEALSEVEWSVQEAVYLTELGADVLRDEVIEPKLNQARLKELAKKPDQDRLSYLTKKGEKRVGVLRYMPMGVVGMIKPWNFPVEQPVISLVPALMAGNSLVYKPSEYVSLVSQELAKLLWQAGVPKDVFQIIFGRGQAGAMLVDSEINMVSFTGSIEVGREIAEKCASRFIRYTLELGGSSPAVILKDADLELAVNGVLHQRYYNCGQVCNAIKRVIVEKPVAEKFTKMLIEKVKKLRIGDPLDRKTQLGPLVSQKQLKRLQKQVTRAVVQSGRILEGGRRMRDEEHIQGFYHEPTVMVYVRPSMDIMQEEIFGPVLPICMVDNFEQALKVANQTRFGLTATIFTRSKEKAQRFLETVEAGGLAVNEVETWDVRACWGGVKESGVGVELGKHGIWSYAEKKYLLWDWSKDKNRSEWLKLD